MRQMELPLKQMAYHNIPCYLSLVAKDSSIIQNQIIMELDIRLQAI